MNDAMLSMPPYDWQKPAWRDFYLRVADDKLPHAFLLVAREGMGAEGFARAMGQVLLCLSPLDGMACGKCRSCQLLRSETHPDLVFVSPEEKSKVIKIDQIRKISDFVNKTAQQGGRKVIILRPAEAMNISASNALLKNLEEPSGDTVFLLVTSQTNRLLATIRSRCSQLSFTPPTNEQAIAWLASEGHTAVEEALDASKGAPLLAKQWLEGGQVSQRSEIINDLGEILGNTLEPMVFAKKWTSVDSLVVLEAMVSVAEALIACHIAGQPLQKGYKRFEVFTEKNDPRRFFLLRDRLLQIKTHAMSSSNLNSTLLLEDMILSWDELSRPAA